MKSPPTKRIKLESSPPPEPEDTVEPEELEDTDAEHCSICLQPYADRTMIPTCSHEFCFECLLIWSEQSRRCPLCSQDVGKYLMHNIRSKYDYQKHYLPPLRTSPQPESPAVVQANARRRAARRREIVWGQRRQRELEEADELERAIEKRRWVYRHRLYAKHVASNPYTRYRPFPTPAQFAASQDYISRATVFIRRELRVWAGLDVEFLTTFTVSLMKSLDIRSEPAVRLLSEFLDMDAEHGHERANAEHFAHELYCYLRSPYRDLAAYDNNVQYDVPPDVPGPNAPQRAVRRWHARSRSRSRSHSLNESVRRSPSPRHRQRYTSRSPSSRSRASPMLSPRGGVHESGSSTRRAQDEDHYEYRHGRRLQARSHSRDSIMVTSAYFPDHRTAQPSRTAGHGGPNSTDDRRDRKGKQRAEDVSAANLSTRSSRQDDAIALGGGGDAGRLAPLERSVHPRSDDNAPGLSTPPLTVGVPAPSPSVIDVAEASTSGPAPRQPKQPVRIRRNAWQTMQEHLTGGIREPRPNKQRDGDSRPVPVLSQSQAPTTPAPVSGEKALRPGDTPPSDDTVPSLLLRLSDPISTSSTRPQNANSTAVAGPGRDLLSAGKSQSTSETVVRTRARDRRPSREDPSSASRRALGREHTEAAEGNSSGKHNSADTIVAGSVAGDSHMPMSSVSHSAGTSHGGSGSTPADPRFLLMQKLELEKRRALAVAGPVPTPTAEKEKEEAQLSSLSARGREAAAHPRDGPREPHSVPVPGESSGTRAGGARDGPSDSDAVVTDSELELSASAERREAQLRSQAQLRVRLAAAKRAALHGAPAVDLGAGKGQRRGDGNEDRTATVAGGSSPSSRDEKLTSQEILLKSRLKARMA